MQKAQWVAAGNVSFTPLARGNTADEGFKQGCDGCMRRARWWCSCWGSANCKLLHSRLPLCAARHSCATRQTEKQLQQHIGEDSMPPVVLLLTKLRSIVLPMITCT